MESDSHYLIPGVTAPGFAFWVRLRTQIAIAKGLAMLQTKSGSRFFATIAAVVLAAGTLSTPQAALAGDDKTAEFLKASFSNGKFIEGFTPGVADFGFSLEGLLQRKALGESTSSMRAAVAYLLQSKSSTGTTVNYTGYLFSKGQLRLGQIGKWSFASKVLGANNLSTRKSVLTAAAAKLGTNGDFSVDSAANTYDRAWMVLGLVANGYSAQACRLAQAILRNQSSDGGWDDGYTIGESSPDGTGIVLQALAAAKRVETGSANLKRLNGAISRAVAYLNGSIVTDHFESWGDYNTNGTAYAAMGLNAVGKPNQKIKAWLQGKVSGDGGLETPWSGGAGDPYATAQGAIALQGGSYAAMIRQ